MRQAGKKEPASEGGPESRTGRGLDSREQPAESRLFEHEFADELAPQHFAHFFTADGRLVGFLP